MKYFLGIGGIGVSALARFYLNMGERVAGSDSCDSEIIRQLKKEGALIHIGHDISNIPNDCSEVIFSPAIKDNNVELEEIRRRGIKTLSYPQALGDLSKDYRLIAVTGTHGKSTTTAMLGLIMIKAGLDPTVIVGTRIKEFGDSNFRAGHSDFLVIEACEHEASFLNYYPSIAVITNIEEDHLDYYGNLENIEKAFQQFVSNTKELLVKNETVKASKEGEIVFSIHDSEIKEIAECIGVPGEHNYLNALAAYRVAEYLGVSKDIILDSLNSYKGSWRRFEVFNLKNGQIFVDDYAHHPTEIKMTFSGLKERFLGKKICCVYQPHQYQRTKAFFVDFVSVFKDSLNDFLDKLIIIDVYDVIGREGNEEIKENYNSKKMVELINHDSCFYLRNSDVALEIKDFDVVVMMGAGDIYNLSQGIKKEIGYSENSCLNG